MGENSYTVYRHTTPSGKSYIGITSKNVSERWLKGGRGYRKMTFWRAIEKYGWDNIQHEILFERLSKEEAEKIERDLISEYHLTDRRFGYNNDNGGKCVGRLTEESKQKISDKKKGIRLDGAAYQRICKMNRSAEHREAVKQANYRKLGIPADTKSRRERMTENKRNKKRYVCYESGEVFETAVEASRATGASADGIREACKKHYATAGGLHWCYDVDLQTFSPQRGVRPAQRRVTNVETGEIFTSGTVAAMAYGVTQAAISYAARHKNAKCAGFHWAFTDGEWKKECKDDE